MLVRLLHSSCSSLSDCFDPCRGTRCPGFLFQICSCLTTPTSRWAGPLGGFCPDAGRDKPRAIRCEARPGYSWARAGGPSTPRYQPSGLKTGSRYQNHLYSGHSKRFGSDHLGELVLLRIGVFERLCLVAYDTVEAPSKLGGEDFPNTVSLARVRGVLVFIHFFCQGLGRGGLWPWVFSSDFC